MITDKVYDSGRWAHFNVKLHFCILYFQRTDSSPLAQFFHSDEELNMVATELDSFDGRKDPERCNALVNQLRVCQDKVMLPIFGVRILLERKEVNVKQ